MYGDVIESAVGDSDRLGPLYKELMPKGRPLAPEAASTLADIFRVVERAENAGSFLLFLLDMATHEGGELIHAALKPYAGKLEELSISDDEFAAQLAVTLLGYCGPDDDLAEILKQRTGLGGWQVSYLLIAVTRLQGAAALDWLEGFLAPQHPPAVRVSAVVAMRLAGSPALPGMLDVVVSAWEEDPGMDLPSDEGARLKDLASYLGPQLLSRLGRGASPGARQEVARTLGEVTMPDHSLLRSLLEDPVEDVQKRAWQTVCCTGELARQNTDVLAKAISDGHPVRFSAANALAQIGDGRGLSLAAQAIRQGKAGKAMLRLLAEQDAPFDDEIRDATLNRISEVVRLAYKPGFGMKAVSELSSLLGVIVRHGGPECTPNLTEALQHADAFGSMLLKRSIGILGGES